VQTQPREIGAENAAETQTELCSVGRFGEERCVSVY
jgi:hypothetical protein